MSRVFTFAAKLLCFRFVTSTSTVPSPPPRGRLLDVGSLRDLEQERFGTVSDVFRKPRSHVISCDPVIPLTEREGEREITLTNDKKSLKIQRDRHQMVRSDWHLGKPRRKTSARFMPSKPRTSAQSETDLNRRLFGHRREHPRPKVMDDTPQTAQAAWQWLARVFNADPGASNILQYLFTVTCQSRKVARNSERAVRNCQRSALITCVAPFRTAWANPVNMQDAGGFRWGASACMWRPK